MGNNWVTNFDFVNWITKKSFKSPLILLIEAGYFCGIYHTLQSFHELAKPPSKLVVIVKTVTYFKLLN